MRDLDANQTRKSILVRKETHESLQRLGEVFSHTGPPNLRKPLGLGATIRVLLEHYEHTQKTGRLPGDEEWKAIVGRASLVGRPRKEPYVEKRHDFWTLPPGRPWPRGSNEELGWDPYYKQGVSEAIAAGNKFEKEMHQAVSRELREKERLRKEIEAASLNLDDATSGDSGSGSQAASGGVGEVGPEAQAGGATAEGATDGPALSES